MPIAIIPMTVEKIMPTPKADGDSVGVMCILLLSAKIQSHINQLRFY